MSRSKSRRFCHFLSQGYKHSRILNRDYQTCNPALAQRLRFSSNDSQSSQLAGSNSRENYVFTHTADILRDHKANPSSHTELFSHITVLRGGRYLRDSLAHAGRRDSFILWPDSGSLEEPAHRNSAKGSGCIVIVDLVG